MKMTPISRPQCLKPDIPTPQDSLDTVPYIRPNHTTDVKPTLESPTTHTEPVTTPNHIDSPHQPTNPTLAPSPTVSDNSKPHPT